MLVNLFHNYIILIIKYICIQFFFFNSNEVKYCFNKSTKILFVFFLTDFLRTYTSLFLLTLRLNCRYVFYVHIVYLHILLNWYFRYIMQFYTQSGISIFIIKVVLFITLLIIYAYVMYNMIIICFYCIKVLYHIIIINHIMWNIEDIIYSIWL